ncbi:transcriptional repressor NrdR [Candidatus Woesearchaeota archaeon]|nr:transcriptional repressor NrdR [Candidatus Woesearchaeota archaeon]
MKCPFCNSSDSKVIDKRETEGEESTRRRRECLSCSKRFTTYERIELTNLIVIKKEGVRQQFDRQKILRGLIKACEKREVSLDQLKEVVDSIESDLRTLGTSEISSTSIGEKVMEKLKKVDEVSYIRFASVYREFTDLTSFEKELKKLLGKKKKKEGISNV